MTIDRADIDQRLRKRAAKQDKRRVRHVERRTWRAEAGL